MTSQRRGELEQVIGEVAASYGAGRLIDSLSSAQLPNKRQVIEARRESETILAGLTKGKKSEAWRALSNDERRRIETLEEDLIRVQDGDDYQAIRKSIDVLNEATTHLAEMMMDTAVSTALKGKNMDESDLGEGLQTGHPVGKAEFE